MKAIHLITYIAFTTALLGCQVELTPFDADNSTDNIQESSSSSDTNVSNTATPTNKTVTLYWSAPLERVNGNDMASAEIGGYEIRYKKSSDETYENLVISDSSIDQHSFLEMSDADVYVFEVAVFDIDGIYSDFVIASAN